MKVTRRLQIVEHRMTTNLRDALGWGFMNSITELGGLGFYESAIWSKLSSEKMQGARRSYRIARFGNIAKLS